MDQNTLVLTAAAARFASCDTIVGITLVGYDYLIMLPKEIQYIWFSGWTPGKVLFIIVRYMPLIDIPVWPFADAFMGANLPMDCNTATYYTIVTFIIAACLADFTYGLRTWALWNRNKWFGIFLILSGTGFNLSCILLLAVLQSGEPSIRIPGLQGCFAPPSTDDDMWKAYLLTTSFQVVLFLATIVKGIQHLTRHPENLTAVLYRDAFLSFLAQLSVGYLNVILLRSTGEPNYSLNLTYRALTSNLPSRIIINIREAASGLDRWDCTVSGSDGESGQSGRATVGSGSMPMVIRIERSTEEETAKSAYVKRRWEEPELAGSSSVV